MKNTTLCYIENERGDYLMLHRVKKENDCNRDKWIGVGGKFEDGESPEECVLRETLEETGLAIALDRPVSAAEAVEGADVVVTDTWISMGQAHAETKLAAMMPFQVDEALMARARPGASFLHCLPAHRGEEVTPEVIDGPRSLIWPEAKNRLHAQKSILRWCFGQID